MSNAIEAANIFDNFPVDKQDMPRDSFIKEYCRLTDTAQFRKDTADMLNKRRAARDIMRNNKVRIERAIENGR